MSAKIIYQKAFTIVELLIVIVVIGILVTLSVISYNGIQQSARDKSVQSDLDALDGIETDYGVKNNVAGKAWFSGNGVDADLGFTPSTGNVIDVVVNSTDYCIRGYNVSGNKNSISNSFSKESSSGVCALLPASISGP
jgi:prepilin-type N-terminal cleavage/methylation domain-containing protein